MKSKVIDKIEYENGKWVAHLDTNYLVEKIAVTFSPKSDKNAKVTIEYAQNKITSDLILFADSEGEIEDEMSFSSNSPAAISDLYISISDAEQKPCKIELYLAGETDRALCYPLYKDYDLGINYYLDSVTVFTPEAGYTQYTIYTSMDGSNFYEVARKTSEDSCPKTGETYLLGGIEARIIRVFIEYNSLSDTANISDLEYEGRESHTPVKHALPPNIPDFADSGYALPVTAEDTYSEMYGIIERRLGKEYTDWFSFTLCENEIDYFDIESVGKKIHITGSSGVAIAMGLNHYLKYVLKVHISQVGDMVKMPPQIIPTKKLHRETRAKYRYAYNYCTHSYSMAFWGENEWRAELDWLALNGVNLVLDITAQEEVWRRFLGKVGYPHDEIKKFIAGPSYYAWAYMANLSGFGGPVHDSWFERRTELARKNHLIMRRLGMQPVLAGYSGIVPNDFRNYDSSADIINQGTWCSFRRPDMLRTTSQSFRKYAKMFYEAQREVFGDDAHFFATDPFHEGGITDGLSPREIANEVLSAMLKANEKSVWVIQSWQENPTSELLAGLEDVENGKSHALVLDLYAEKSPNYAKGNLQSESHGYDREFNYTPWVYCMLNNFGGRCGMHGHLDNLAREIPRAFNECRAITGIGITPEASMNNPVLYDFFFETVWCEDVCKKIDEPDLTKWLFAYTERRYGQDSKSAKAAWEILKNTVYKAEHNNLGQGAPESVVNARPALKIQAASTWGNAVISYDKKELEKAEALLLEDYSSLCESEGYLYDVVTLSLQVLSNKAQDIHTKMAECFEKNDIDGFSSCADELFEIIDKMEETAQGSPYYSLDRWLGEAIALGEDTDDFSKNLYLINAKALVTTWGAYNQAEAGGLRDYSNRQWSGLFSKFYKKRWEMWVSAKLKEADGAPPQEPDWFGWEWNWVRQR